MKMQVRVLLSVLVALALMFLAACGGSYNCAVTFGSSSCTPSGSGFGGGGTGGTGGGGGGGGGATAFAYAVDQIGGTTTGTMDGFELNVGAGTFAPISGFNAPLIPPADPSIGVVVAQQQFLYTAFASTGQIYGWSVDKTSGALTAITGSPYSVSYLGFVGVSGFNQLSMITNPAGTLLFVADAGNDEIWVYEIGPGSGSTPGVLTPVPNSPFSTGAFQPWNMTTDGLGKYLYVTSITADHQGLGIAAYSIGTGSSEGTLAPVVGSPFFSIPPAAYNMWAVQGEPSGTLLIGTSGQSVAAGAATDDKHLYVYYIEQSGTAPGSIKPVANSPFATTYAPFNIAVQPVEANGEFVYSFSVADNGQAYNPLEGYLLNTTTGALTPIVGPPGSPFSGVTFALFGQFDQSGDYLFSYGDTATPQLAVMDVAAGTGALTEPLTPTPLVTTGYWAVTDPQ
jgi:6-phosphogluconolactonase